jgi:hypothetical protein
VAASRFQEVLAADDQVHSCCLATRRLGYMAARQRLALDDLWW